MTGRIDGSNRNEDCLSWIYIPFLFSPFSSPFLLLERDKRKRKTRIRTCDYDTTNAFLSFLKWEKFSMAEMIWKCRMIPIIAYRRKKFYKSSYEIFDCENRFWRYSWLSLIEKKEKKRRNIVRMLRVTEARVNICINSLFVRRPNAAYENKKKREKNKNLKKAHVHALNKRPIFTFGFAENVDGWISNRTSRVVNEDCSFPCNCYRI